MKYLVYIIVGILLFLIIKNILGRVFPKLETANYALSGLIAIGLTPLITKATLILFFNLLMFEYHPDRSFSVDSWKENIEDRHQMSEDLLANKILIDKTQEQIVAMLGIPNNLRSLKEDTQVNLRYSMGNRLWGFGLKFYYLDIEFEKGKSVAVVVEESID